MVNNRTRRFDWLLALLLLIPAVNGLGQTDTEFWFVAPEITIGHGDYPGGEPVYFRVSALDLDAQVRIFQPANPGGMDTSFTVSANTTLSIDASPWINDLENRPGNIVLNKGVQITSNNLITVYYDEDEYWNQDIFALKGRNALGMEFYTPFNNVWRNGSYTPNPFSSIDIVATEDNTTVWITPTAAVVGHSAGLTYSITLNKGQTYSCLATSQLAAGHLGGTHITSNKPIAVTLKDDSLWGQPQGCKDLVGDQTVPLINANNFRIVGYEYIVMRGKINLIDPNADPPDPVGVPTGERIFIMATEPNTEVTIDGVFYANLASPGQQVAYEIRNNSTHVEGDKPIMVLHIAGFGCEFGGAILPTIDGCTGSVEVSFTRSTDRDFYLNIMTIDAAKNGFTMHYEDGSTFAIPGTWFEPVGATDYVCLKNVNKLFANNRGGGVPQGEVVKVTNDVSVFHLGLIEGGTTTGCKYGYFSDYSASRGDVRVVESGSKSIFRCFGDTVQLRASGGITYSWAPSAYLDDPFSATPIAAPPPGVHNYDVTLNRGCFPDTTITVIVGIAPEVESYFEMDKWYICAPDTVTFDNASFGVDKSSVSNMQWDFDLADPSSGYLYDTSAVVTHVFNNPGDSVETKTVQLVVWNSQSCISEFRRDIIVRPEIRAGFANDVSEGCQPVTVQFSNTSSGNIERYKWELGDGTSANTPDVTHTYLNTGMADSLYHVEMVAISPFYCTDTVETDIAVYPYIEASFAIDTFQGCSPLTIHIDNNSAGYIEEHEWQFGDMTGSASPGPTLTHTYSNPTSLPIHYTLRLVVKNNTRGCTDTLERIITVFPEVTSGFLADQTMACHGTEIGFENLSSATASIFEWDFGDGGSSSSRDPFHTFENMTAANSDYTVRLVSTTPNLCRDTSEQIIRIHPYIRAEFSVNDFEGCAPFDLVLQNSSEGAISDYDWDWGDLSLPSDLGDTVLYHTYQNNGTSNETHSLRLVVQNADHCSDTMIRDITVFPEVVSLFTPDVTEGCNELEVSFTNESSASANHFLWDFGDGGSSEETDMTHLFKNTGPTEAFYTTRLIASTNQNCRDTAEVEIEVYPYLRAGFTFSQATVCSPYEVTFTNTSVGGVSYHWEFGDGSDTIVLNSAPVSHWFVNPSPDDPVPFQITLTATNARGCTSVISREITVMPSVEASFTVDRVSGCHPLSVSFTNTSSGADSYHWDFDNGHSSNQPSAVMTFENYGSNDTVFHVVLTAVNEHTCVDSFSVPILVHPYVGADFSIDYQTQCSPARVTFHNASVNGQEFAWLFDNAPYLTNDMGPIERQFDNPSTTTTATLPVNLTVTSPQGCIAEVTKQVSVFHTIEAAFTSITEGCTPLQVQFNNISEGASSYTWDLGDYSSSVQVDPQRTYTNDSGSDSVFHVTMTAMSENFCRDTAYGTVTVFPGPRAMFDVDLSSGCSPLDVTIENRSQTGVSYIWDFNDGSDPMTVSDLQQVTHRYTNDQSSALMHDLRLDVVSEHGCSDFITQSIAVYPVVTVDFGRDSAGCSPHFSQFVNTSQNASRFTWDFGDGGFSFVTEPGHTYVNTGEGDLVVDVELRGYSEYGCGDTLTRTVTIYPSPEARFSYTPIYQYYPNATVSMINETNPGNYTYEWDFDDGQVSPDRDPGSHTYTDWGDYNITLTASNDQCSDSVVHWVKIFPPQPIAEFIPDRDTGCVPVTITMTNLSQYGESYLWEFDDGTTSTEFEPTITYDEPGYYQVKLTVTGEGGQDFAFHEFDIYALPEMGFHVEPELVMLPDEPVKSFNITKHGVTYRWDFGDGSSYYAYDTTHQYVAPGVYDISLTAWTIHGCEASMTIPEAVTVIGEGYVKFPNAFRPNMTGPIEGAYNPSEHLNQVFHPVYEGVIQYELVIYDRWGEKLFQTNDITRGWDGYNQGTLCAQGVYVWRATVTFGNGKTDILAGDVTLLYTPE